MSSIIAIFMDETHLFGLFNFILILTDISIKVYCLVLLSENKMLTRLKKGPLMKLLLLVVATNNFPCFAFYFL